MRARHSPAALLILLSGCGDSCRNLVVSRERSPDGARDAAIFHRGCGATTGLSTQVSLVGPGRQPSGAGTVFRADDDHGAAHSGSWGGPWAEARWLAPDRLLIRYAAGSRIFRQASDSGGVRVTYEAVRPPNPARP